MNTALFNTIDLWIKYPLGSGRSLWVKEGKENIRWINRKDYRCFRQNGRLQDIFGVMKNQLCHLSETKNIQSENIKVLISLKEQVSKSYSKYHKCHNTFILGFFYRLLFARSLNSHYNSIISSIDSCLKKHLSKIPLEDFKKFIKAIPLSYINLNELSTEQLSWMIDEKLNRFDSLDEGDCKILYELAPKMSEDQLKSLLKKGSLNNFKIDALQESHRKLMIDHIVEQLNSNKGIYQDNLKILLSLIELMNESQLNSLDLSKWPSDAIFDLYESSKLSHAKCTETILFNKWSFQDVEKFVRKGLKSFSRNIISLNWSQNLREHILGVKDLSSWASTYLTVSFFAKLPNVLLAYIMNFYPNMGYTLANVSKTCVHSMQINYWGRLYLQDLNLKLNNKSGYLFPKSLNESPLLRIKEINQNIFNYLPKNLFDELKNFNLKTFEILTPMQAAKRAQLIEDVNLVLCAPHIFRALALNWEEIATKIVNENNTKSVTELYSLKAKAIREKIKEKSPEVLASVKELDLTSLGLTSIPKECFLFENLKTLDLSLNQLTSLPAEIRALIKLKWLDLSNNRLTSFPPEIGALINLVRLDLSQNQLPNLSSEIGALIKLVYLNLSHNQLPSLPAEIRALINLKELFLKNNRLINFPQEIAALINLVRLDLSQNQLSSLPAEIKATLPKLNFFIRDAD